MSVYGSTYILERVRSNSYGRIDIFEGHVNTHNGNTIFQTMRETNPDAMYERMKKFCEDSTGDFTVYCRQRHNGNWGGAEVIKLTITRALEVLQKEALNGGAIDIESIVTQRIQLAMQEQERQRELQMLKDENDRLKQPIEKITFILERVFDRFAPPEAKAQPLNGTPKNASNEQLNVSVKKLIEIFGVDGIVILAEKLSQDDSAVTFVKQYCGLQ